MDLPALAASVLVSHRRKRRRAWLVVGVLLALFIVFEVGIRNVPPDGMTVTGIGYSEVGYPGGFSTTHTFTYSYTSPQDQQTINDYYASINDTPAFFSLPFTPVNCALTLPPYPTSIAFTWHGIPLETWFTGSCLVGDTAGGIPDFLLIGHFWYPDGPLPPPASQ